MARIDDHISALYALPPERFTAERDRIAADLKAAGDAVAADALKALRRPTVAAWAIDAAVRSDPRLARDVVDAGAALAAAQRRALSGGGADVLRTASDERRRAVRSLAAAAVSALERDGRVAAPHRDAIAATLEAASVDKDLGGRLLAGTLDREVRAGGTLGVLDGLTVLEGGGQAAAAPRRPRTKAGTAATAVAERERAEAAAAAAAREAERATTAADRAEREAAKAKAKAERLRARADEADAAAREAETQARQLAAAAATTRRRADRAADVAASARRRVDHPPA